MQTTACVGHYLTCSDVAREANRRGDSLTPAGVRLAADTRRLRVAALTANGQRLFLPEDVEAFLAARAARRVASSIASSADGALARAGKQ